MSGMGRREFVALLGGAAAAWPIGARARQAVVPVIGFLCLASRDTFGYLLDAFRRGLAEHGCCSKPKRGGGISLGGRPIRPLAGTGKRSGPPPSQCDRRADRHSCRTGSQGRDVHRQGLVLNSRAHDLLSAPLSRWHATMLRRRAQRRVIYVRI
jgi:hypothetical protein